MESFFSSVRQSFKERVTSPLLGTFIISRSIRNRNILYTTLFVDQNYIFEKYGLLKNQYIEFLLYHNNFRFLIVLPLLSVGFIYRIVPFFGDLVYEKHLKNYNKKENMRLESEEINLASKERIEAQRKKTITAEVESVKEEKKLLNVQEDLSQTKQEQQYQERKLEYNELKKKEDFNEIMKALKKVIFELLGWMEEDAATSLGFKWMLGKDRLSFLYLNGLVEFINDNKTRIDLTEKGKYILMLYENQ